MTATGNLSIEAQERYAYIERLLLADVPPPARVVELGSAPGDQIAQLADRGYDATSVDLDESADNWGFGESGRMKKLLADAGVTDLTWDLEETPYPLEDGSFDAVIMTEVFEHLRDYPIRSLHEIHRVLVPGGRLYFTTPNAAYLMTRLRLMAGQNVASPLRDWIAGHPHSRHAREYTFAEIDKLMDAVGLQVVMTASPHFYLTSGQTGRVARFAKKTVARLSAVRPTLGSSIVIVAERPQAGNE